MVRVGGYEFNENFTYQVGYADATITLDCRFQLTDEQILALKEAKLLEAFGYNFGEERPVASFALVGWKAIENTSAGQRITWQTYKLADIADLKQDNEDLTQALLELAEIVGGGANG